MYKKEIQNFQNALGPIFYFCLYMCIYLDSALLAVVSQLNI